MAMLDTNDPQDPLIRMLLLGGAVTAVVGFLLTAILITIMISTNFNPLGWME